MTSLEIALAIGAYENIEMKIINVQGTDVFDIKRLDVEDSPHFLLGKDCYGNFVMRYLLHQTDNLISVYYTPWSYQVSVSSIEKLTKWIDEKTLEMCKKIDAGIKGLKQAFINAENLPYGSAWMHESLASIRDNTTKTFVAQISLTANPFMINELYVYNPSGKKEKDKTFYIIDKYVPSKMAFKRKTKEKKLCPVNDDIKEAIKFTFPELF
ncbi:MAG TPA: hypothetical protein VK190_02565 [Pseudoneobacillus sp.]|nr:hypothetical protein [Pseudoneobacillus sp.]